MSIDRRSKTILIHLLAIIAYGLTILVLYYPAMDFEQNIDDTYYFKLLPDESLPLGTQLQAVNQLFNETDFRPITLVSFIFEQYFFHHDDGLHHTFNLLYYFLLIVSIHFLVLRFGARGDPKFLVLAIGTSLLFLVHPSHVNVVASMKNRESILSLLLSVLAFLCWLRFVRQKKWWLLLPTAVFLFLGYFSKRDMVPFLLILPVVGWMYHSFSVRSWRYPVLSVLLTVFVLLAVAKLSSYHPIDPDKVSQVTPEENPVAGRQHGLAFCNAVQSLWLYERFMFVPKDYHFYFGYDTIRMWDYRNYQFYLLLLLHLVLGAYWWSRWRKRDPASIGPIIFLLCLVPFLNLLNVAAGIVAVRYSFAASLGFCLTVAWYSVAAAERFRKSKWIIAGLWIALLGTLAIFSRDRLYDWRNKESLFENDLPKLERSVVANRMAASHYLSLYEDNAGKQEYNYALFLAEKYNNRALAIYDADPQVIANQAKILGMQNDHGAAHNVLRSLVRLAPDQIKGWSLLASHAKFMGYTQEAIVAYHSILEIDAGQITPYIELTALYARSGDFAKADSMNQLLAAFELPDYPQLVNAGNIALIQGDTALAVRHFAEQLEKSNSFNTARYQMLLDYANRKGDTEFLKRLLQLKKPSDR